ncbi:2-hydroxychromene-2-carboxylate isomerase [Sneathiella litorea]|uniref:2-hydroxychromene-2-carboxylate isomerase n=1 Tax=Sneathiella litorea TaxID=2606216 RepID=A0A6L8WDK4_9PROT|nr:DsbA family protein [Sneathiella litorea]MZR32520.1 2-hydroxychromene-2-carboxylate isomerase [Sneathiella litorea]
MTYSVDLFWSFRSPYSYLATGRIVELTKEYDLRVNVRPVYPIAVRTPEFFKDVHPLWIDYLLTDIQRVGDMNGIPISWPRPDPVKMNRETKEIPREQPYIHRLTHLGVAAAETGNGLAFLDEISQLLWNGNVRGWHEGDHLAKAAAKAGFDLAHLDSLIADDFDGYAAKVEENQAALEKSGHWGVPTLAYKNEAFFGQDRVEACLWRMKQDGLTTAK